MSIVVYILSIIGVVAYMFHFWHGALASAILWPIAGFCATFSIYGGIIGRYQSQDEHKKVLLLAATVIGCLIGINSQCHIPYRASD